MEKPNCRKCRHFFITWSPRTPNGCKKYGIETQDEPHRVVSMAGMGDCQGYEARVKKSENKDKLDLNRDDLW